MTKTNRKAPQQATKPQTKGKPQQRVRGKTRRHVWFHLRAAWLIFMVPLIFLIAAAIMIIDRDITAPSWVVSRIEERAQTVLNGGRLQFGEIFIRIGSDLHPRIRLVDTQLYDESGLTIARIPSVDGLVSPRGIIFKREMLFQEVALSGAQINLRRAGDGSVSLAFGSGAGEVGQAGSLPELLDQADQVFERPALEALETIHADGLIVNFDDARAGRSWIVDGGVLDLDLRENQTVLQGDFSLLSGRAGVTTVGLFYASPRGSRASTINVNLNDAIASDVASQSPALSWLAEVDAPVSIALRTELDEAGALGPLDASLDIGAGALQPNPATRPVSFDGVKALLTYQPARHRIAFTNVEVDGEWGHVEAAGEAYLRQFANGLPQSMLGQLRFSNVSLNPAELYPAPLSIPQAAVDLRLRLDPFAIDIGQVVMTDGATQLSASGDVQATPEGWRVAIDASADEISPAKVLGFWPPSFKPGSRRWVENNITAGRLFDITAGLRIAHDTPRKVAVGFEFENAGVRFMRRMPPISGGRGIFSLIDNEMVISADGGVVSAAQGGQLDIGGSVFSIPDIRVRDAPAELDLAADGTVTAVLSMLNQPPFEFLDKAGRPVTLADGRAAVSGELRFPLKGGMTPDELFFDVGADVRSVRSETLISGRTIAASRMSVRADRAGLTIAGPVRVGAVPMDAIWEKKFGAEFAGSSELRADVRLSQDFLDEFGIALPSGTVAGETVGQLQMALVQDRAPTFRLTSDLRGARLVLPAVGWSKAARTQGELRVVGRLGAAPEISELSISGGGLSAQGRITFDGGRLDAAQFSRVRLGNWLDAPITLRGRGSGQTVGVEIDGGKIDLRQASFGASDGEGGPVTIALDRLQVTEGISLTGFRGDFNGAGGFSGQFQAQVNGETAVRGTVAPRNGRSAVRIVSDDAGGVMRAAGFLRNAFGGSFDLTLLPAGGEGTFDGILAMRSLRVRDAPAIASLLDAISVVGLLQQLDGQGLSFDGVDARFRLDPTQVTVTEASAVGPGLGISLDGIYTLASKQMDFQGVVSPFYLVNSIGSVLTRRGEGLIGFNFTLVGPVNNPRVGVNPLSVFTPGMFRDIFRRPAPEVSQ